MGGHQGFDLTKSARMTSIRAIATAFLEGISSSHA